MEHVPFGPGTARAIYELMPDIQQFRPGIGQLVSLSQRTLSVPTVDALNLLRALGWVNTLASGQLQVTQDGLHALTISDPVVRLRNVVRRYVECTSPPWAAAATFGRQRVLKYADSASRQLLQEAGLAHGLDEDVVAFWDELASRSRGIQEGLRAETGRIGERLTINFEFNRTGFEPKWIALEDNADGYDVLSRITSTHHSPMTIEVKTSTLGQHGYFYLTRNEWETAWSSPHHQFHLWSVADTIQLAVLVREEIEPHIPINRGSGSWQQVSLPFARFSASFRNLE